MQNENTPKYLNHHLYSDVNPYEVIESRGKTLLIIRAMKTVKDPDFKPEFVPGGFSAVCVNQNDQRWIIEPDETAKPIKVRRSKAKDIKIYIDHTSPEKGSIRQVIRTWGSGTFRESEKPLKFYDYNF